MALQQSYLLYGSMSASRHSPNDAPGKTPNKKELSQFLQTPDTGQGTCRVPANPWHRSECERTRQAIQVAWIHYRRLHVDIKLNMLPYGLLNGIATICIEMAVLCVSLVNSHGVEWWLGGGYSEPWTWDTWFDSQFRQKLGILQIKLLFLYR